MEYREIYKTEYAHFELVVGIWILVKGIRDGSEKIQWLGSIIAYYKYGVTDV
jgi:hypothetical protein